MKLASGLWPTVTRMPGLAFDTLGPLRSRDSEASESRRVYWRRLPALVVFDENLKAFQPNSKSQPIG
jgi:hypothetical protein